MSIASKFYSKLLLFGEYTIIDGGTALSMPLKHFYGQWAKSASKSTLSTFFKHLLTLEGFDKALIKTAIAENWVFESSIPQGSGLGSSGALTAAAYNAFCINKKNDNSEVRRSLANIESFFHGRSSGLDPLTSYLNRPITIQNNKVVVLDKINLGKRFFLIDSAQDRDTKSLVAWFHNQKETEDDFTNALVELDRLNRLAIASILCSNSAGVLEAMRKISALQFEHFKKLIPKNISSLWSNGLEKDKYFMKLSGAGGGGFFLVYGKAADIEKTSKIVSVS